MHLERPCRLLLRQGSGRACGRGRCATPGWSSGSRGCNGRVQSRKEGDGFMLQMRCGRPSPRNAAPERIIDAHGQPPRARQIRFCRVTSRRTASTRRRGRLGAYTSIAQAAHRPACFPARRCPPRSYVSRGSSSSGGGGNSNHGARRGGAPLRGRRAPHNGKQRRRAQRRVYDPELIVARARLRRRQHGCELRAPERNVRGPRSGTACLPARKVLNMRWNGG